MLPHKRVEMFDSVIFGQLIANFEDPSETIFKQLKLLSFPVKRWHRCGEWLLQLGNAINVVMKNCRFVFVCRLLKVQQKLVGFDCRRGVLTADLQLNGRELFLLVSWRCTGGAVCDFLGNSCHHVVAVFRARFLCHQSLQGARSRLRITLGVFLIRSLVGAICVPGCLRSGLELASSWESHQEVITHVICGFPSN